MKYRNIDRNVRSTVTVAYIYIDITYGENVALKSQVWGSLTLAQSFSIFQLVPHVKIIKGKGKVDIDSV